MDIKIRIAKEKTKYYTVKMKRIKNKTERENMALFIGRKKKILTDQKIYEKADLDMFNEDFGKIKL